MTACVFLFDGYADWEPASAMAELRRTFGFDVRSVAMSREPVVSMGGLRVTPDGLLSDLNPATVDLLILPGGDMWTKGERPEITALVRSMVAAGRPVAAICAATLALAHAGLLDDREHTSNGDGFIYRHVPTYRGASLYRRAPAVSHRGVITATGVAPIAFAAAIFRAIAPEREQDIAWYEKIYTRGILDSEF